MEYSNDELKKLWTNHEKRKAFIDTYKDWGVYAVLPEFNLTFYRYALPDNSKLIVMEYMQKNHYITDDDNNWRISTKKYLQKEEYFMPNATSDYEICNHLMDLKKGLVENKFNPTYTAAYENV